MFQYQQEFLKKKVSDGIAFDLNILSICVDEHSLCGLSITGDIKIYQCRMIRK